MPKHTLLDAPGRMIGQDPLQPLHVVIAHEDLDAYRRALRMLVNALGCEANELDVRPLPWRFSELGLRTWRDRAWSDAERADMFVVATSAGKPVPADIIDWLEISFERRRDRPTAVVLLEDDEVDAQGVNVACRERLRRSATAAGLDFLEPKSLAMVGAA